MKALVKTTSLFSLLVISALFCVAQQTPPPGQQPLAVPVSNSVQLVIEGKVIKVHDGDTVTLLDQTNKKSNIRLQGIDAPELKQAFGAAAQANLSRIVLGKHVTVYWTKVDKYRRTVGTIMLDGRDVNIEQVKAGVAWHFKKYEDEQPAEDRRTYAAAEQEARAAGLGLWGDPKSIAPGDWRQAVKIKRWGPPPPEGTIIGNLKSKKFHRPDCPGYRDMAEDNRAFFKTVAEAETAGYKRAGNCPAEIQPIAVKAAAVAPTKGTASESERETRTSVVPASHQPGEIIGNKNSKVYHLPGCAGYSRVSEQNQVKFTSREEAEKAGYKIAGNCSPKDSPTAVVADSTTPPPPSTPTSVSAVSPANPAALASSNSEVIGNKNSKIYHLPGCAGYTKVSEQNQVKFTSREEAEKAGYKIAGNCSPKDSSTAAGTDSTTPPPPSTPTSVSEVSPANPAALASSNSEIIGNKNSKIYHLPGCAGYTKVSEQNQVKFTSAEEAEKAGFRLAKNCSPKDSPTAAVADSTPPPPPSTPTSVSEVSPANPAALASSNSEIIGNKNSKIYHLPGCAGYTKVSEQNQVKFTSREEAEKAGFRIAKNCSANKSN